MIVKRSDGYYVTSEKGKNLGGPYKSRSKAKERLAQVEAFKHMNKGVYGEFDLLTIDDAWRQVAEFNKAVRGHTKVRATKVERVGPGTHRIERKKKAPENEDIEKATKEEHISGIKHWMQDYKKAQEAGNTKLAKEIKTNIIAAFDKLSTKTQGEVLSQLKQQWTRVRHGKMETVHRKTGVEKFRGGVGIKFRKEPKVEKFRGGIGIKFD